MKNITLPPGTERLLLEEIAHYIADAMNPEGENDPEGLLYELDKIQAWNEAEQAAKEGTLRVRHPGTHGPFPSGLKLRDNAVVLLSDVAAYFADRGLSVTTGKQEQPPAPASNVGHQAWQVYKPQRFNGYTVPLHRLLSEANRADKPRPTARDVLEAWRTNPPAEIAKVLTDSFDYYDSKGDTKPANLKTLQQRIKRMTSAR